jgi:hypothetical protein
MNPFDPASGIQPYETILYATADYYYTKKYASTKSGSVSGVFNPYVIPGYPMDILEANPNLPSFHAMCTTVTHNITSSSISTHIDFVAAMTYSELANYYIPFVNPYLQVALGLAANPTLVNNTPDSTPLPSNATLPDPYKVACQFYQSVLGVDAVTPEMLFGFNTSNAAQSVKIENSGTFVADNRKWSDHSTEEDILTLCIRPIENKDDFASRSDIIYIDLTKQNYAPPMQKYADPNII